MFGVGLMELGVLLALPLVVVLLLVAVARGATSGPRVAESWRVLAMRMAGLLVGVAGAFWVGYYATPGFGNWLGASDGFELGLGRGPLLAPVTVGAGLLVGVVLGELLVRPATGPTVRTADLAPRRVRDYAPRPLSTVVVALTATCAALLIFTTRTASADDMGRAGRSLTRSCLPDQGVLLVTSSRGPYPGSFYSLPLALALLLCLGLAWYAARRAVLRPRGTTGLGHDHPGGADAREDVLRRRSVTAVVAALGIAVAAPLTGVAATAASALGMHTCPAPGWQALSLVLGVVAVVSVLTVVWCLVTLAVPATAAAPRREREPRVDSTPVDRAGPGRLR